MADDVQLIIDIAQKLTGQETTAELDALTATLSGTARETEALERANIQTQAALDAVSTEAAALGADLKAAQQEYAGLQRASIAANKAAQKAIGANADNAQELVDAGLQAQAATSAYADSLQELAMRADQANAAQEELEQQAKDVAKVTANVGGANDKLAGQLSKVQGAFGDLGGPVGRLGEGLIRPIKGFTEMSSVLGGANSAAIAAAAGYVALAAAVVAVTAVIAAFTAAATAAAIALADNRRNAGLAAEAFDAMNPAVAAVRGQFDAITRSTGVASDELQGLAKSLDDAGVSAAEMPRALRAAALAEAALGKGGAAEFVAQIKKGELAVDDFAATTQQKLGGIVNRQVLGLGNQFAVFKRNIGDLFGDLNIEGALAGISKLVALFDVTTASGKAIKLLFEAFFQPLVDSIDTAATAVEAFVLGVLISLVTLFIKLKPTIKAISEFFGFDDPTTEETFKKITAAGEVVGFVIAGIAAAFLAVAAVVAGVFALLAAPFILAGVAIFETVTAIVSAVRKVGEAFQAAFDFVAGIEWGELGTQIMQGLADGISGSADAVIESITGAVGGAITAAKEALGISSPSKVFAEIGVNTGEGFAGGVESETDTAQDAMSAMIEPPAVDPMAVAALPADPMASLDAQAASASPGVADVSEGEGEGEGEGGAPIDFSGATFNFFGVEGAEDAEERFAEVLTRIFEGDAASLGATP